ncbi:sushi domain-containing protein 6 [Girardinichthys multiradiatus]|uniref:sushi domain-containing protein 6 n=1 Tax=Girardinichthys multiradiatus TaxID=208333 RepID=UPI001FAD24DB|nr:sushi domain-containing protein 6 [Girardinichthys multiradiatus]XP_047244273.1 sushi domain-containing protein 6 [Girardinichthys multiradiatus]
MCDGMVAFPTRAPSSSSGASSSSVAHRLAAFAFLLLFILLPHGYASGCAPPPGVEHGSLLNQTESNQASYPPGSHLTFSCDPGYTPDGQATIFCTSDGAWSHPPPNCIKNNVCSPPTEPENGGYRCHPTPCHRLTHNTVIEYFCDEGYTMKGDYKYLTCLNGEWDSPMQISCRLTQDKDPSLPLGMPALSIVLTTASSVLLILLLVVLFVLVQPKLKSFHHNRREPGVSGQTSSIMVEGVQVSLPSYEEAVYGSSGMSGSPPSPPPPIAPPDRVPIVLSEGLPQGATGGQSSSRSRQHRELDFCLPSTSSSSFCTRRHAETVLVHQAPSSSSCSSSTSWSGEHLVGACAGPLPLRRDSESSDQHSLLSVTSVDEFADDIPLLKEA